MTGNLTAFYFFIVSIIMSTLLFGGAAVPGGLLFFPMNSITTSDYKYLLLCFWVYFCYGSQPDKSA